MLLAKNYLRGPLPSMLNNKAVNQSVEWYLEMGTTHPGYSTDTRSVANVVAAARDKRDPMLVSFEKHLLQKLAQSDVCRDERSGTYLFNVNRVAYLVEKSETKDEQSTTRRRMKDALPSLAHIIKRVPPSNNSECFLYN